MNIPVISFPHNKIYAKNHWMCYLSRPKPKPEKGQKSTKITENTTSNTNEKHIIVTHTPTSYKHLFWATRQLIIIIVQHLNLIGPAFENIEIHLGGVGCLKFNLNPIKFPLESVLGAGINHLVSHLCSIRRPLQVDTKIKNEINRLRTWFFKSYKGVAKKWRWRYKTTYLVMFNLKWVKWHKLKVRISDVYSTQLLNYFRYILNLKLHYRLSICIWIFWSLIR